MTDPGGAGSTLSSAVHNGLAEKFCDGAKEARALGFDDHVVAASMLSAACSELLDAWGPEMALELLIAAGNVLLGTDTLEA